MGALRAKSSAKMATCCYCGRKTSLVLCGTTQHELACGACGAPLHVLKNIPLEQLDGAAVTSARKGKAPEYLPFARSGAAAPPTRKTKRKKKKKKKSLSRRLGAELFDLIEDIFD
ncbi:MAG: hypothetical protein OIF40_10170 [Mangrovicoccus sp.]|nr:hypothetical protein [Mangrovicoccus sp.]